MLGAELLNEAENGVEQDDEDNGDGVGDLAEEDGDDRCAEQYHDHDVLELPDEDTHSADLFLFAEDVGSVRFQASRRLFFGKSHIIHSFGWLSVNDMRTDCRLCRA